ncbi:MAG TPA: peptidoglycan-associated lipoprotein Pal, partial [Candidatus Sulfotelmatobacter sp.]|nr:peptidoglycan-associated lipoprotein Pal [Candidatus Sulfotelmatobacter sp.]
RPGMAAQAPRQAPPAPSSVKPTASPLHDVFFDFDASLIRPDQVARLKQDLAWLNAHPNAKITVTGNCDERGTEEYNLALGERRAAAAKDFLVAAGIPADRISTLSYGDDRPFARGHDEHAWQLNRRDHFVPPTQ